MNWLKHIGGMVAKKSTAQKHRSFSAQMEALEDRLLRAHIGLESGVISIEGSERNDVAKVEVELHNPSTALDDRLKVSLANDFGSTTIWYDLYKPGQSPIVKVVFNGLAGDDQFYNLTSIKSVAHGYAGKDILVGGS